MVINKKKQVIYRLFLFFRLHFFSLKFVGTVFVSSSHDLDFASIISLQVITELSMILAKCLSYSQLHVAGFQM